MVANDTPSAIHLHRKSGELELQFNDLPAARLGAEYLRVHSPSAEVRGHGPGQETLQTGKKDVLIEHIEPVGHYAIKLRFSDGHDSGIYSWTYLRDLTVNQDAYWTDYLQRLRQAGARREALPVGVQPITLRSTSKPDSD
jgi:DUF971 family protein